ncbi:protein-glutamine gamma-glutamyltransferase 4-like [Lytechinus pictus]|uniref:protein-glutamine gamma-glutamyltransferase 4-like n=1 Tax=Lytechinus pictus TaxID=7653 RepID=UPI0030BA2921
MGSGSSRSSSGQAPAGTVNRSGDGRSSSSSDPKKTGWEWFEINFSSMELGFDSDDEGDAGDDAPPADTSPMSPGPEVAGEDGGGTAPTEDPGTAADSAASGGAGGANMPPVEETVDPSPGESDPAVAESDPAAKPEPAPANASESTPAPVPAPAAPDLSNLPSLSVTGVNLFELENAKAHHTDEFEQDASGNPCLIVRRGQEFTMEVNLNRKYCPEIEKILLRFAVNTKIPRPTNGTMITLPLNGPNEEGEWSVNVESIEEKSVKVKVKSAPTAIVGCYMLTVIVKYLKSGVRREFAQRKNKINMLFNPWCEKDSVFLESEDERQEYVMEDMGLIWRGSYKNFHAKKWNFGQFDLDVREVVFQLLEDHIKAEDRWNPVKVSRVMSSIINESGRGLTGILVGNWSGSYDDGTSPTKWNGSVAILEEYKETGSPVLYGQCWVFSGVFTTILRCLGIPARSVTNFASAHDTDDNMTIDKYVDLWGNDLKRGHDSVWNFHVWNEAWMTRPDLDPGLGGWQAVDATPQETSDGQFQCGPAPVIAVKRGLVNQGHDTRFVFAEVNADRVTWEVRKRKHNPDDPMSASFKHIGLSNNSVGKNISTKAVGSDARNDVTSEYKFPEGSAEERAAVMNAVNKGMSRGVYREDGSVDDVVFVVDDISDVWIGDPFRVSVKATNKCDKDRTIFMKLNVESCYYTGIALESIKREKLTFKIGPGETLEKNISIEVDDYLDKIDDQALISVFGIVSVKESSKTATILDEIRLKIPDLEVKGEVNGSEVCLTVGFKNPLQRTLTDCEFVVEAPKLVKPFTVKHQNIQAGETISKEIKFKARARGRKEVLVEFDSQYLKDVTGSVVVHVKEV